MWSSRFPGGYFGLHSFIRGLLYDFSQANPLTIVLVFFQVLLITSMIWIVSYALPKNFRKVMKIRYWLKATGVPQSCGVLLRRLR